MNLLIRSAVLSVFAVLAQANSLGAEMLYWASRITDTIQIADIATGTNSAILFGGSIRPWGIAIDRSAGHLYFTNGHNPADTAIASIRRINLDGTGLTTLTSTVSATRQIALDLPNSKMYWAAHGSPAGGADSIYRANLDGTGTEAIVSGLWNPRGIALDLDAGKVYFHTFILSTSTQTIKRANLDGSGVETLVVGETHGVWGMEVDRVNNKLYWGDGPNRRVRRSNLDGTGVEDVLTGLSFGPLDMKIDNVAGKLYVSGDNPSGGGVVRSNLDGTNLETLFSGGGPTNIVLGFSTTPVPEPSSFALLSIGLLVTGITRRVRRTCNSIESAANSRARRRIAGVHE